MSKKTSAIGKIYQALIYVFLYAPILVIGLFSFCLLYTSDAADD